MDKTTLFDYFNGRLSSDQEKNVLQWLAQNPESDILSEVLSSLYDSELLDHSLDSISDSEGKEAFEKVSNRLGLASTDRSYVHRLDFKTLVKWTMRLSACLVIPLAISLVLLINNRKDLISATQWHEITVPVGDTSCLTLSDGTMLHLNSGTRVTYPTAFYGNKRQIYVDGEVLAKVAHNPNKPFIIHSGAVDVRVLGTKFNFKSYEGSSIIEIFLMEGSVRFDINDQKGKERRLIKMSPGEMVQYDKTSGDVTMDVINPSNYKSFTDGGSIHFFNMKMSDIADDLERHFGKKIVIMDETVAQRKYFALFSNDEGLYDILKSLSKDRKMTISERDDVIYLSD
jgi:transmembrane sensor